MAIINGQGRVGVRVTSGSSPVISQYPSSLKLFIDAGNPLSYSGTGTTVTDLVGTQNGTLVNGVGYSSSDGGYFTFDGVNDYIDFGTNTAIQPTAARTVSIWAYITPSTWGVLYADYTQSTGRNGLLINKDANGGRVYFCGTSGNQYLTNSITSSSWRYITISFNGTTVKTYNNGVLINSATQNYTMVNGINKTTLGDTYPSDSYPLNGRISQLKIYNTQLSDAEVLADFNEFKTRYGYLSDSDAAAFVSAAGITDSTQASAVNTLVTSLKTAGIWSKMKALYPFVGGNATAHKFNLKDPRDLDVAYRLVFSSGWSHSSTGALPNGTSAYADTKFIPLSNFTGNSGHISHYNRTNSNVEGRDISADSYVGVSNIYSLPNAGGINYSRMTGTQVGYTDTNSLGMYILNRNNTNTSYYKNGTLKASSTSTAVMPEFPVRISGEPWGLFSPRQTSFVSIGDGLTDSEASAFYTAVQAFQTTLGRQV